MSALAGGFIAGSELRQELLTRLTSVPNFQNCGLRAGQGVGGALSCAWIARLELVDGGTRLRARLIRSQKRFMHRNTRFVHRLNARGGDGQTHEGIDPLSSGVEIGLPESLDAVDEETRFVGLVVPAAGGSDGEAKKERRQDSHVGRVRVLLRSLSR